MRSFLFFLFLLLSPVSERIISKIIGITDGDTVVLLTQDRIQIKVRLYAVDYPESKQVFGYREKQFTSDFCFGKEAVLTLQGKDRYGRTLGLIIVGGDTLNYELLKARYTWHYKQYNKEKRLSEMEQLARSKRVGLWADKDLVAPWAFRRKK